MVPFPCRVYPSSSAPSNDGTSIRPKLCSQQSASPLVFGAVKRDCSPEGLRMRAGTEFKHLYRCSEAWRTGNGGVRVVSVPGGTGNSSALQIAPSGHHMVLASGSRGSCSVIDLQNGRQIQGCGLLGIKERQDSCNDDLDGLYSCAAISGDCQTVGFGSFDGLASIHDVMSGKSRALLSGAQHRAVILSMALSQDGSTVAAGLSDGQLALARLSTPGEWRGLDAAQPPDWSLHWVGRDVGITCLEANIGGASGESNRNLLVAGTSGGHVKVMDGVSGKEECALVGGCSCPVTCLALSCFADQGGSSLVYGGFSHHTIGNGHSNSVYVWDARSALRVARLHLSGGGGGQRQSKQGRGTHSGVAARSICADPFKVVVTAGKGATVFETRMWQPLYEMSFSQSCWKEESGGAEEEEGGGGGDKEEWFWSRASEQRGDVGTHVTAKSVMMCCVSPRPVGAEAFPRRVHRRQNSAERGQSGRTKHVAVKRDPSLNHEGELDGNGNGKESQGSGARGLSRTKSDGDLADHKGGMKSSSSGSLNGVVDEPAGKGLHFSGSQLAVKLKSGRVGIVDFGSEGGRNKMEALDVRKILM